MDGSESTQHDQWLAAVYQDQLLVTHYEVIGTMPDGQETRIATSPASIPRLVAMVLDRLAVADGHQVLEIGTGTGYNAALLATRLGDDRVTSIEVDQTTADEAADHLAAAGYRPALVVGDGAAGHPDRAPYDWIIATCAVNRIPPAWIEQLTDDGIILAPLTIGGGLAVLHKTGLGEEVTGRLDRERAYFMPLHAAGQPTLNGFATDLPQSAGPSHHITTNVEPDAWANPEFRLWLALHRLDVLVADGLDEQGDRNGVIVYTTTNRASVDYSAGEAGSWPVTQDQAELWNTVETAWRSWLRRDRPDRTRIGITARLDGEQ